MQSNLKKILGQIANTVRGLSMDAVQKANSGHPGLPMGCAELGAYLWGCQMRYNPKNPGWKNRDYFILSAGHGSMWLYSFLHLTGYSLSLEEIKRFRQLHSLTPGHPEYHITEGVEVTTGPLGQGVANAVGVALGLKILAAKFNTKEFPLFTNKVFCLAGDGCIMEGVSSEASSFAGHLGLDNLIIIYDSNNICLDGPTFECLSEDTKSRYKAYGFEVLEADAYDFESMDKVFSSLRKEQKKPAFVIAHTIIGKGSPNKAGTHAAHGSALGEEEVRLSKKELAIPDTPFFIPKEVEAFFAKLEHQQKEEAWKDLFMKWAKANPELAQEFIRMEEKKLPENLEEELVNIAMKNPLAGRNASQNVLQYLSKSLPYLYGGSADLSGSDMTMMKDYPILAPENFKGRNVKYGVREFAMSAITNGLFCTGMILPYCGTFLTFSDYMRNAIRLAALSKYHVIYQFTHDSIFLGEDGPTHQPIEHLAALRAIPNLQVIRPGDNREVKMAWIAALKYSGPTAIILSRQALPELKETQVPYNEGVGKGAYLLKKEKTKPDVTLMAAGSEISLAMEVAARLEGMGKQVRVISFPCWDLFEKQPQEYRQQILGGEIGKRVCIEAGSSFGWAKYIGSDGIAVCVDGFGHSAPIKDLAKEFGFTADAIIQRL